MRHANGYVPGCEVCALHQQPRADIGRTTLVHAPRPAAYMLDLARAESVLGHDADADALARYMSLNGTSLVTLPVVDEHHSEVRFNSRESPSTQVVERRRTSSTTELVCLMCARSTEPSRQRCRWCDGSLVVEEAVAP